MNHKNLLKIISVNFILLLSISSCTVKKPEAPEWDVTITIPLINKDYYIGDLQDEEYFFVQDSIMHFGISDTLEPEKIGDYLFISEREQSYTFKLKGMNVESPGIRQATYFLYEFLPDDLEVPQEPITVDSFDYGGYGNSEGNIIYQLAPYDKIKWAIVDTGWAIITLENNTSIPFGSPIIFDVHKRGSDTLCFSHTFYDTIFPGETRKEIISLSDRKIYRDMDLYISGHSIGTLVDSVQIDEMTTFTADIEIGRLKVKDTDVFLPKQNIDERGAISIEDTTGELQIKSAEIDSCFANIYVRNELPQNTKIDIIFDELKDKDNNEFHISLLVDAHSISGEHIDLKDFKIYSEESEILDSLHFNFQLSIIDSTKGFLTKDDSVYMKIHIGKMKFKDFEGIIDKELRIERTEDDVDVDYPEDLENNIGLIDSLTFLEVFVDNNINVDSDLSMIITGINQRTGESSYIYVDESIIGGDITTIKESGKVVTDLLEILPSKIIKDSIKIVVDSEGDIADVNKDDDVSISYKFITPFQFELESDTVRIDSSIHIEIEPDNAEKIRKNVKRGKLYLNVENSFPFGASVSLYFSIIEDSVFSQPELVIDSLDIKPAPFELNTGLSTGITDTVLTIDLDKNQVDIFSYPDVYLGLEFIIEGSQEEVIAIKPDDHITIIGRSVIDIYVH